MSSIFAAPGASQREDQEQQQKNAGGDAYSLWNQILPGLKNQFKFMGTLEPMRQAMTNKILALANPAMYGSLADAVGNKARQAGVAQSNYAAGEFGPDSGVAKGAFVHGLNSGTQAENDFMSHILDPATQAQIYGSGLSAINNSTPELNQAGQLYGMVQGQHPVTVGKGFGDYLAPVASAWAGGGGNFGSLFGGGGGGSYLSDPSSSIGARNS